MGGPVRRLFAGAMALPCAAVLVLGATTAPASAATTTVTPTDDSYVRADLPGSNFGTATSVQADASPVSNGYLKFTVSGLGQPVAKATLRLFSRSTGSTSLKVSSVASNSWNQGSITYDTAPTIGTLIGSTGAITSGTWAQVDVTSRVLGNGTYSFAVTTGSTAARLVDSKEAANPPQLVIQTSSDPVVVVGGDVACDPADPGYNGGAGSTGHCQERATADLIGQLTPAALLMLGDGQYNAGSIENYNASYDPTWGTYKSITYPTVGNHDFGRSGASGYFTYFGNRATPLQPGCTSACNGYYSLDVGTWHIVNIDAECTYMTGGAGCAAGSAQDKWLENDLATHANTCTLVFGHRPRWSSNSFASADIAPLVSDMYAAGVDLYVSGHAHSYERFAPQNPSGQLDTARGVRQFIVGTGGNSFTGFGTVAANSQVRKTSIWGVMKLTLHPTSYEWTYVSASSTPFSDSGTGSCH